jgi:hypothetical protein
MPPKKKRYSAFDDLNANGVEKHKIQPPTGTQPAEVGTERV